MAHRPQRVLLAFPHVSMRDMLHWLLQTLGYAVTTVDGAGTLDELLRSAEPLVVVVGLAPPHLGGGELMRLLAASPHFRARHRFIVVSWNGSLLTPDDADAVRARALVR
jgi:CheY-like chemotaxis protein